MTWIAIECHLVPQIQRTGHIQASSIELTSAKLAQGEFWMVLSNQHHVYMRGAPTKADACRICLFRDNGIFITTSKKEFLKELDDSKSCNFVICALNFKLF